MNHKITHLPKDAWQHTELPGCTAPLYAAPGACTWGLLQNGRLAAAVETCPEPQANWLRLTTLWVDEARRGQGLGRALLALVREQALHEHRRAVLLDVPPGHTGLEAFAVHEGFAFSKAAGALAWQPPRRPRLARGQVELRPERTGEHQAVEAMVRDAFWNKFQPGADEHLLVHKLRRSADYRPELSRIALVDGEVAGAILYTRAAVRNGDTAQAVLSFGPLAVAPGWRGSGLGELLCRETLALAAEAGWPGVIIFGEPTYYPRLGFVPCERFGITTAEGKNFEAFMGLELAPDGLARLRGGAFHEAAVFSRLPKDELAELEKQFPPREKQYFPGQF